MLFGFRRKMIYRQRRSAYWLGLIMMIALLWVSGQGVRAQDEPVSYDDVNDVAARMYCPECEMVPLDRCFTEVCIQWKQDIAEQLATGRSSDQIVDDFVARFGDQVVGVPQDSALRSLTLAAPLILALGIALVGAYTLYRLRGGVRAAPETAAEGAADLDHYRARLEEDLKQ